MAFVHYRSPDVRPGHLGESLRTKSVVVAWTRVRLFLESCTENPPPQSVVLRVDRPVDDNGSAEDLVASIGRTFGKPAEWRSSSGAELAWEWSVDPRSSAAIERVVATCADHEARPRVHVNAAVRDHGSPPTPQVSATLSYAITLQLGVDDTHVYRPGWGQSQARVYLGYNEIWLLLHFPFASLGPELEAAVASVEAALGHTLSRKRLKLYQR